MHKNRPFLLLLVGIFAVTLWFGVRMTTSLIAYLRLNTETTAQIESLEIHEGKGDHYQIYATYSFESTLGLERSVGPVGPIYKNPWSAEKGLAKYQGKSIKIWYNAKRPFYCSTTKVFPMKITLSTTILFGLVLYFVGLGLYVGSQGGTRS